MTQARVYGIDFGTSHSALRIGRTDGGYVWAADPAATDSSATSVPTVVSLSSAGHLVTGHTAWRSRGYRAQHYRAEFKRHIGEPERLVIGERAFLPHELAACVLGFLRDIALTTVDGAPQRVALAVPASWERTRRELMREAALVAGFAPESLHLVDEPVAAAATAFADAGAHGARTMLIYDLGGGTFDCAVARSVADGMEVLGAPGGRADIGGSAFDNEIAVEIARRYPVESAELAAADRSDVDVLRRLLTLRASCEKFKLDASVHPEPEPALLTELRPPVEAGFTRAEIDELIGPMVEETLTACEETLAAVGLGWSDVDRVVPVGGSVRYPLIGEMLARRSGCVVLKVADPELAVANGAALLADRACRLPGVGGVVPPHRSAVPPGPETARGTPAAVAPVPELPVLRTLRHVAPVRGLAYRPGTGLLGATGAQGTRLWTVGPPLDVAGGGVGLAFDPTSPLVAVVPSDGPGLQIYDVEDRSPRGSICTDVVDRLWAVSFSPDGRFLATVGRDSRIVPLRGGRAPERPPWHDLGDEFRAVAWSGDGLLVATGAASGEVFLTVRRKGTERLAGHRAEVVHVAFDARSSRLVTVGADGAAHVMRIGSTEPPLVISPGGRLTSAVFLADGEFVAVAAFDGREVVVHDSATGSPLRRVGLDSGATGLAIGSENPAVLAVGAEDGTIRLVDLRAR